MDEKESAMSAIYSIARAYYTRQDVQKAIFEFCQKRETIARHHDKFSKRPDTLEYPADIIQQVKRGFTSFHCSEELWENPLEISTEMQKEELDEMRSGWDLLIDIDSKYLDYSKIAAQLIVEALKFHNIKNLGIKFSGGKGFHIIVPWKAFPKQIQEKQTRMMFPEWPRAITQYLNDIIKPELIKKISESLIGDMEKSSRYIKGDEKVGDSVKKVMPDLILVSSRHLFRAPYSLHEKGKASVVLNEEELKNFEPKLADPLRVLIKDFYPDAEEGEARELLVSALDWSKEKSSEQKTATKRKFQEIRIDKSKIVYPPCIFNTMKGMADGKKRALFILINYFRSLGLELDDIEEKLVEWNKKNKPQIKQGYITSQINWHRRQKTVLPPNCARDYYKGIGVCEPDEFCRKIKNPVNYSIRKEKISRQSESYNKKRKAKKWKKKQSKSFR